MSGKRHDASDNAPGEAMQTNLVAKELPSQLRFGIEHDDALLKALQQRKLANRRNKSDNYGNLLELVEKGLERRLGLIGMSAAETAHYARTITPIFQKVEIMSLDELHRAVEVAASTAEVMWREAVGDFQAASSIASGPPRWSERRPGEFPTAESFLRKHYEPRLGVDGDLTQADLSRLDQALFAALRREFKGRLDELHRLLPTLKERNDAKLMRAYGYVPQGEDRKSKLSVMSMRPHG